LKNRELVKDPDWLDEISEVVIRGDFQDHGYYEIEVTDIKAQPLDIKDQKQRILVIAHVKEGQQFRLGDLSFKPADPEGALSFARDRLYQQFAIRTGEVFNVDQIRFGVKRLGTLYASDGYIDFVAEPDLDIDHIHHRISVNFKLWEGPQYRVESVEVTGLDPKMEAVLRAKIKAHDLFDNKAIEDFFAENKKSLPPDASSENSVHIFKNRSKSTLSLHFDFYTCPPPIN